jgi:hypothetical protein
VCGGPLTAGGERFANAWERSLGQRGCCGDACVARFDPDRHWIPSRAPAPLGEDEVNRFLAIGKSRLRDGDPPAPVARDMLLAGVPSWVVRRAVYGSSLAAASNRRQSAGLSLMTLGRFVWGTGDKRDPDAIGDADPDIEAWEARFGTP